MAQTLKLRRSAIPNAKPTVSQIEFGEVAMNTYDGKMFMRKSSSFGDEVVEVGASSVTLDVTKMASGSITASVFSSPNDVFLITSESNTYWNISSSGNTDIYSSLFIIRDFTTKEAVFSVSESIATFSTQSQSPTGSTNYGSIWFTSESLYIGVD
jgi:hypothetical protein